MTPRAASRDTRHPLFWAMWESLLTFARGTGRFDLAAGGERFLFLTDDPEIEAFSPDGAKLAYARGGRVSNVWRVPILSDRAATWVDAERVTSEHAYIEFVDVSPDGKQLAVSSDRRGNQDLWLLPSSGGEMTPLTNDPTPDWNPRWSPDGTQLAFYAYRSGNRDIWVMPSRGGPARQLTSHPGFEWFPSWSRPDGREIAFQVQGGDGGHATFIVSAAGGEPRLVSRGTYSSDWSPGGQSLVVVRQGRLFRVPRDGGEPLLLPTVHHANTVRFSVGGQSIDYSVIDGPREHHGHWRLSLKDGTIAPADRARRPARPHGLHVLCGRSVPVLHVG